jgi:hypothetical protein
VPGSFRAVLDETVGFAEEAIVSIEAGDFPERELHYLRQRLLDALALFERDAGIEAAVADLYAAATALAIAQARSAGPGNVREERAARDAFVRFRRRLSGALPNEAARNAGIT